MGLPGRESKPVPPGQNRDMVSEASMAERSIWKSAWKRRCLVGFKDE